LFWDSSGAYVRHLSLRNVEIPANVRSGLLDSSPLCAGDSSEHVSIETWGDDSLKINRPIFLIAYWNTYTFRTMHIETVKTLMTKLQGRKHNRQKQLALEIPTWYALLWLIAPYFVEKDGLIRFDTSRQRTIACWQWGVTLTWFRKNNEKVNYGTHTPDFVIKQVDKPLLAIECKNVNHRFKIYPDWLTNEVVSRFENYHQCRKLAIFSFFVPAYNYETTIHRALMQKRIQIIELDEQPLSHEIADIGFATIPLRTYLSPHVTKVMEKLKPTPMAPLESFSLK